MLTKLSILAYKVPAKITLKKVLLPKYAKYFLFLQELTLEPNLVPWLPSYEH